MKHLLLQVAFRPAFKSGKVYELSKIYGSASLNNRFQAYALKTAPFGELKVRDGGMSADARKPVRAFAKTRCE